MGISKSIPCYVESNIVKTRRARNGGVEGAWLDQPVAAKEKGEWERGRIVPSWVNMVKTGNSADDEF